MVSFQIVFLLCSFSYPILVLCCRLNLRLMTIYITREFGFTLSEFTSVAELSNKNTANDASSSAWGLKSSEIFWKKGLAFEIGAFC